MQALIGTVFITMVQEYVSTPLKRFMIVFKQYFFHLEEITRMCMSSIFVSIQDFHEVDVLYEFCQKQKKTIRNLEREIEQMRRVNIKDMIHFPMDSFF